MPEAGHRGKRWRSGAAGGLLLLLAAGCGYQPLVPTGGGGGGDGRSVADRGAGAGLHVVRPGETLYSIAWEAGYDYREVAAWNGITPPYLIKPGQVIRLEPPAGSRATTNSSTTNSSTTTTTTTAAAAASPSGTMHTVARGETLYRIARRHGLSVRDLAAWNGLSPPYTIRPGQRLRLRPPSDLQVEPSYADNQKMASTRATKPRPVPAREAMQRSTLSGGWIWPAEGELLARFDPKNGNKGIDIGGQIGQAVLAAASGTVVYQGSGLRGYGQLIIIKHNSDFLSAYAHNDKIYVKEGDVVKQGQKIAAMGNTGTDRVKLHFEIRSRGVPVDPLDYLPKR